MASKNADWKTFRSLTKDELTLVNYIKQAREQGKINHQITLELTKDGWSIDGIAAAFRTEYLLRKAQEEKHEEKMTLKVKKTHHWAIGGIILTLGIASYVTGAFVGVYNNFPSHAFDLIFDRNLDLLVVCGLPVYFLGIWAFVKSATVVEKFTLTILILIVITICIFVYGFGIGAYMSMAYGLGHM